MHLSSCAGFETPPVGVQATVSPIYPFTALCVCLGLWLYHHTSISSDWMNPAEAGALLNSARVHYRTGLEACDCSTVVAGIT